MVFAVPSFALFKRFLLQEGSSLLFGIQQEGENCMTISIVQTFNPPLRLYMGVEKVSVKSREWQMGENFVCLNETEKGLITRCNRVPTNKKNSGCKIWLQIDGLDVHVMVAEKFLDKPEGAWGVHHIDNNSYNNSVTNLVWVTRGQHNRRIHPMSYR